MELVEVRALMAHGPFKDKSAAERMQMTLRELKISTVVPAHLTELAALASKLSMDGPGVIAYIRNKLVHSTAPNRQKLATVSPVQLYQAGQLGLTYIELCVLALIQYRGKYCRRAFAGYRGADEEDVPWI